MSRFLPTAHDPNVHREEVLTLARTTSQQYGVSRVSSLTASESNGKAAVDMPRRKHFVFTDPVAFRYEV